MARDRDRNRRLFDRATEALFRGNLEEADRQYRRAGNPLGIAMTALHRQAWERAARKALAFLEAYDALPEDDPGTPGDEAIALRTVEIALARMAEETLRGAAQRRRDALAKRARERLATADWPDVRRRVRKFADAAPEVYGPLATERVGRRLVRESLATAADLLLEIDQHPAESVIHWVGRMEAGAGLARAWPVCLHCYEAAVDSGNGPPWIRKLRAMRPGLEAQYAAEPEDREHALLFGVEALHLAEVLGRGGDRVGDLLARADALLAAAPGLEPAEEMEQGDAGLLAACVGHHRARVAELQGRLDDAITLFEDATAREAEPWSERAAEVLARVRSIRDADARRRKVAELRARWAEAREAGDAAEERGTIAELLQVADEDALWERLARLEVEAGSPGWTDRAAEAVRRGSRNAGLIEALATEAIRLSPDRPREAVVLFRLALRGGPLDRDASATFASALIAAGRRAEAGKVYKGLAGEEPLRHLDAAKAYAAGGEPKRALSAIEALLETRVPKKAVREAYRLAADLAPPDALRSIAEKVIARDPKHRGAAALVARLEEKDFRLAAAAAARAREEGLAAAGRRAWRRAAERLASVPPTFRDPEARFALARALEETGRPGEALVIYGKLASSRGVLEGRARCHGRTGRFEEARSSTEALVDLMEDGVPALGEHPDLLGLLAEARENLQEAAGRYEDEGLLRALADRAEGAGDAIAEYTALARLADRHPERAADVRPRIAELDAVVPVRAKARYARDLPTLVLCDTNVLLADLLEAGAPRVLDDLRRPPAAERLRALRGNERVRLAVTKTIARELRAVLRYRCAVQEDEEAAEAVRTVLARAEAMVDDLDVLRVAGIMPKSGMDGLARVREFYRPFRSRLRRITNRKAGRTPERARDIRRRRAGGRPGTTELPERADLRLLAEAAWLAEAPLPGIGGVGIASDDADFRAFRREIEGEFGVSVV